MLTKSDSTRKPQLQLAACAGMFVFGIVMALIGAVLPSLAGRLAYAAPDVGLLFVVMNGAMLVASLVLGLAMDTFGMKPPLAAGPLLVAAALILVSRAMAFSDLLPAVAILGVGGAALNGAANTLVSDLHDNSRHKGAALNRLGVFFGFGAFFLPLVLGVLLARFSLSRLLLGWALLCAAVGGYALSLRFPAPKQRQAVPLWDMRRFLHSPLVVAFAALLFFESGVEFTLGGFISIYVAHSVAAGAIAFAAWVLAGFWAAIMVSRGIMSRLALAADPFILVSACATGACTGALLTALARGPVLATIGILLCGWSLAAIYPSVLGIVGARFATHSGTVFGMLFSVALSGGIILPWIAGQIGGVANLRWVFGMTSAAFFAILLLSLAAARIDRRRSLLLKIESTGRLL